MLRKLANKLNVFNKDSIILPEMGKPTHEKIANIQVLKAKEAEDINKFKKRIEGSQVSLINVSALLMGTERKSFVNRLQSLCKNYKMEMYGLDKNWLVITKAGLER
jgi:SepF-like predicted cell division protein (DUF552 family)